MGFKGTTVNQTFKCHHKIMVSSFNPKQAGGSESMYSLGGGVWRPPP